MPMKAYCADVHRLMAYNLCMPHEVILTAACLLRPLCCGSLEG